MEKIFEDIKNISFREVSEGDEKMIESFFDMMSGETRALFNRRDYNRRGVLKYIARPDVTRRYWLALLKDEMIGYVFFLDFNTSIPTLGLAVRDDLRGQGIGKELVAFAKEKALEMGKGGIQLTTHVANVRAQSLYESEGFSCMGLSKNCTEFFYLFRYLEK